MKKKKIEKKYYIVLVLIVLFLVLGLLFFFTKNNRNLSFIEKGIKDSVLFLEKGLLLPIEFIKDKANEWSDKDKIYTEYKNLKEKEQGFEVLETRARNLEQEVKQLTALLDLNTTLSETNYMNATVINRNIDDWQSALTLDKGSKNGIEVGMAVMNATGLVGRITKVSNYTSVVTLITHPGEKLSVKISINDNFIYGVITEYNQKEGIFLMEGISENTEIPNDSTVMTTGFGSTYPSGLLVGKITGTKKDNYDLARTVMIKPTTPFDQLSYVMIIKKGDS